MRLAIHRVLRSPDRSPFLAPVQFTGYLDAVDHNGAAQENDRPGGADFLLNIYQENGALELGGGHVTNLKPQDEEINVTQDEGWDHNLGHFNIDDNQAVMDRLILRLKEWVGR